MRKYGEIELQLLSIQIGCIIRLARHKKGLSQLSLSLLLGTNPTMIGRIERFETISGWDKILSISQELEVDFCSLFKLKSEKDLLAVLRESISLEEKLTVDKKNYYDNLIMTIKKNYITIK